MSRRSHKLGAVFAVVFVTVCAATAAAQPEQDLSLHPGFFSLEGLDVLDSENLTVEINLHGPLLKLVAAAIRNEDPEFADLVSSLEAVRVRVASLQDLDFDVTRGKMQNAAGRLQERGWMTIVRVREKDGDFSVYVRQQGDDVVGLAILALEEDGEATIINIVGKVDLSQLAKLGQRLDIPHLDKIQARKDSGKSDD